MSREHESIAQSLNAGWGEISVGSSIQDEWDEWMIPIQDDVMIPGTSPSSYFLKLEANFMRDFSCCGLNLPSLYDLLQHYEEAHGEAQRSSQQSQTSQQRPSGEIPDMVEGMEMDKVEGMDEKMDPPNLYRAGASVYNNSSASSATLTGNPVQHIQAQPQGDMRLASGQCGPNSDLPGRIREQQTLADTTTCLTPLDEARPFRCPVIGCEKAYKNRQGLKYHNSHGHNSQRLHGNVEGTFSIVNPETSVPYSAMEKEKPYKCEVCGKRYKTLNGLKYHNSHSPPCM